MLKNKKAQSTLEYAIVIAIIVAGLLAMSQYIKRGYMGKLKTGADELGDQFNPNNMTGSETTNSTQSTSTSVLGGVTTTTYNGGTTTVADNKTVEAWNTNGLFDQ